VLRHAPVAPAHGKSSLNKAASPLAPLSWRRGDHGRAMRAPLRRGLIGSGVCGWRRGRDGERRAPRAAPLPVLPTANTRRGPYRFPRA
jgi:hypothetical protein